LVDFEPLYTTCRAEAIAQFVTEHYALPLPLNYGYETQIVYMLARGDEVIAGDGARVSFQIKRVATDRKTGKPVADIARYTYRDCDTRYVVTFERQKTILQTVFREEMPLIKRLLAKIVGFDGAFGHAESTGYTV
jgi:hypothetical protein